MPHLSWSEVRDRAIRFSHRWAGPRSERADKQTFWNEFFEAFGIRRASVASFEANVRNLRGNTGSIDLLWRGTLLVEHKSFGQSLEAAETQAFGYIEDLTREGRHDEVPRFVLVSDFARFVLYDLEPDEQPGLRLFAGRPSSRVSFTLNDFPRAIRHFAFMLGQTRLRLQPEDPANQKAYHRMCQLHDALRAGGFTGHELERLLVRLLFCLFAEDTGIFPPDSFTQYIRTRTREDGSDLGQHLNYLFEVLDTEPACRQPGMQEDLAAFPYVNGLLFRERLHTAVVNRAMRDSLLYCCAFSWARVSPAVFGSLFQGVMEDRARRQLGAHYTNERDIMKAVRSLFLDGLRGEFEQLRRDRSTRRRANFEAFQQKLRSLKFMDPACGCGNFLVLAYRELRLLEIEVLKQIHGAQQQELDVRNLCKVDVDQFYGIEILEWPVRIAEVALWLMDHQMNAQAAEAFGQSFERLPLRASPHIVHGNALRADWNSVLAREQCSYLLGNPPYAGKKEQNAEQKADMERVWNGARGTGVLDYVACWYRTAAAYISGTLVRAAFVSTNSICQGEQVGVLWTELFGRWHLKIHFAHRTFPWKSDARGAAHVHVVIIGFGASDVQTKTLYDYEQGEDHVSVTEVANINPYLIAAGDTTVRTRTEPINGGPAISYGSMMIDKDRRSGEDEGLILSRRHRDALLAECPALAPYVRQLYGGDEFINGIERWCLWLVDAPPDLVRQSPLLRERIEKVRRFRRSSGRAQTRRLASTPGLFGEIRQPSTPYILIPKVSSELRSYIPIGFVQPEIIASGSALVVPGATHYHFGVLTSAMHNAWMECVAGRMKSDFQYSGNIVYNNFPWPNPTPEQRARVVEEARAVLAAREPHLPPRGMATLADLYDPNSMPRELLRAHHELDSSSRTLLPGADLPLRPRAGGTSLSPLRTIDRAAVTRLTASAWLGACAPEGGPRAPRPGTHAGAALSMTAARAGAAGAIPILVPARAWGKTNSPKALWDRLPRPRMICEDSAPSISP